MRWFSSVSLLAIAFAACSGSECVNEVRQTIISPDETKKVILFSRNCGATTAFNAQATIVGGDEALPDEPGNVFVSDKGEVKISWKEDGGILVVCDSEVRFFKKEAVVRGIRIEYRHD